ncbi:MAG: 16S rRNA (uracil(1498)-N(3))-methyltransferase [Pseudomonadota bacterium]
MAIHDFRSQRLFVDHPLSSSSTFETSREQANYLLNVMRLKSGAKLLVFNGRDGEWLAEVEATGRKKCTLTPVEQTRPQPTPPALIYCFAPLKQARLDYMIQKAVEMGAGVLQPVITEFTQVRSVNEKRLIANSIEAAEQCGVLALPDIREPLPLAELRSRLGDAPLVFCDEAAPATDELAMIEPRKQDDPFALLIGPEGGFSDREREILVADTKTCRLGLGPRILRADTAAVAAMAVLQSRIGDWYHENVQ